MSAEVSTAYGHARVAANGYASARGIVSWAMAVFCAPAIVNGFLFDRDTGAFLFDAETGEFITA